MDNFFLLQDLGNADLLRDTYLIAHIYRIGKLDGRALISLKSRKWFSNKMNVFIPLLTHWGQVMHICVRNQTIIGSDNGLSPGRRQAIIWTNAGILLIGPLGSNSSEILIAIDTFSFNKMHLKLSSAKRQPFCLTLNVLNLQSARHIPCHHCVSRCPRSMVLLTISRHSALKLKLYFRIATLYQNCSSLWPGFQLSEMSTHDE